MTKPNASTALAFRVALWYVLLAGLWVGGTDLMMGTSLGASGLAMALNVCKGLGFVLATALLIYLVLKRLFQRKEEALDRAHSIARELHEFKAIAEHSGEVFFKHDLQNRLLYVNARGVELLGYGDRIIGMLWTDLVTANPINQLAGEATERALRTGQRQPPYLVEIKRQDGGTLLVEIEESPLVDEQGKVIGIAGAARDVTERERTARGLRESEQRFRQLTEAISEVFWMTTLDYQQMLYVSPGYEKIWGRTCESLYEAPASWAEAVHPEDRERVWEALKHKEGREESQAEYRIIRPDGEIRWILDRVFLMRNEMGEMAGRVGIAKDITESRKATEALRESEENLRRLYTSMNEGLALHEIVTDANGKAVDYRILNVNPAFESGTGFSREKIHGMLGSQCFGTEKAPYLETYARVVETGQASFFEAFLPKVEKHFTISVFSPRAKQFATILTDISKRKDAERQVFRLNQVYALISRVNEAIVRLSDREQLFREVCRIAVEDGQFLMAWIGLVDDSKEGVTPVCWAGHEQGYLAQLGVRTGDQPRGRGPVGVAVREKRVVLCSDVASDPRMDLWRDAALERGYRSLIALPLRTNGEVIGAFTVYAGKPNYFDAMLTESLVEVAADISFALDLFERNRQREAEQHQLRLQHSALEAAANTIVITDREGRIEWVNEAFTRLTGYSRQEAIGQYPRILKSGAHSPEFYKGIWDTVTAGTVWQGTLTNRRKDGALYEEEMVVTPVRSADGEISHFVAIKQDITERKKLEQQFLRAQRMQSIGLLAGGVAHDLNNVLAPVLMALPLLRAKLTPEQRDQVLQTLEHSVTRGANIVRQVLTFARGVEVQRSSVQMRHIIHEVARIAEETFPRDIAVSADSPSDLWLIQADPTQLHQVVLNLAVNARDAMPGGGRLSFSAQNCQLSRPRGFMDFEIPLGPYVLLTVADTGTGISPEHLDRIFEPFFTTKPVGKGTGLGLSTVLGIVKSHRGLVEVQSQVGQGSTFTVYLPALPTTKAEDRPAAPAHTERGSGELILVVDDEDSILEITRSILETSGYRVVTARDGSQALERLAGQNGNAAVAAVITDVMMPVMDGLSLVRALRRKHVALPVVAATGLMNTADDENRAAELRAAGVRYFLNKPFKSEELLATLRRALAEKS